MNTSALLELLAPGTELIDALYLPERDQTVACVWNPEFTAIFFTLPNDK